MEIKVSIRHAAMAQNELHGLPAYFTSESSAAKLSVRKLAALEPRTVIRGHGKPLPDPEVPAALHKLADDFNRIAVPKTRRRVPIPHAG